VAIRGGQKAEFGLGGGGLHMFFTYAESKKFLYRWRQT